TPLRDGDDMTGSFSLPPAVAEPRLHVAQRSLRLLKTVPELAPRYAEHEKVLTLEHVAALPPLVKDDLNVALAHLRPKAEAGATCAAVVVRARACRGRTASGAAQGALARRGVALAARRGHRGGGSGRPPLGHVRKYGNVGGRYQHPGLPGGRLPSAPRAVGTGGTGRTAGLHNAQPGHAQPG